MVYSHLSFDAIAWLFLHAECRQDAWLSEYPLHAMRAGVDVF